MRTSFIVVLVLLTGRVTASEIIWSDGFESGNLSAWSNANGQWKTTESVAAAHSGKIGADIFGPSASGGDSLTIFISSLDKQDLTLSYWWKIRETIESNKFVKLEYTPNAGTDWFELYSHNGVAGDWTQQVSLELPGDADNNPNLGLRLRSTLVNGISSDRVHFDDFVLAGVPEPATTSGFVLASLIFLRRRRK
jgi:hypothetical protein